MDDSSFEIGPTYENAVRIRLERIPSPFVWTPREPVDLQVAVVGGTLKQRADSAMALRASGHRVTPYASAETLVQRSRSHGRPGQHHVQPHPLDVVVLHGSGEPSAVTAALELLRSHDGAIPIVLVADDDAEVLSEAKRLCVEEVLAPPVHPVALRAAVAAAIFLPLDGVVIHSELEDL